MELSYLTVSYRSQSKKYSFDNKIKTISYTTEFSINIKPERYDVLLIFKKGDIFKLSMLKPNDSTSDEKSLKFSCLMKGDARFDAWTLFSMVKFFKQCSS